VDARIHVLDIGADGRIQNQICALSVQAILQPSYPFLPVRKVKGVTVEQVASFDVFPESRKEHVA